MPAMRPSIRFLSMFIVLVLSAGLGRAADGRFLTDRPLAPIYHDAHLAVNDIRAERSLKGLLPGESRTDEIASGGASPKLTIACDRLVPGQTIEFEANLHAGSR